MKEKIKKLKETERGRALLKLSRYMIFFLGVILLFVIAGFTGGPRPIIPNKSNNQEQESLVRSYLEKQQMITSGNYHYEFHITGVMNVNYTGTVKDGVVEGYKETSEETIKYQIENGKIYSVKMNQKEEYIELYDGLDENLFDFSQLFGKLNATNTFIDNTVSEKVYTYENIDNYKIVVYTTEAQISKIVIENDELEYEFTFSY